MWLLLMLVAGALTISVECDKISTKRGQNQGTIDFVHAIVIALFLIFFILLISITPFIISRLSSTRVTRYVTLMDSSFLQSTKITIALYSSNCCGGDPLFTIRRTGPLDEAQICNGKQL